MRQLKLTALALSILALGPAVAAWAQTEIATPQPAIGVTTEPGTQNVEAGRPDGPNLPCHPMTIAKGDRSGWGHDIPDFSGADLIIRDPEAWKAFWAIHAGGIQPPPSPPPVDFRMHVVVATIQGFQPSGGGPNTAILSIQPRGPFIVIDVFDDERPGPLDVITNPFHIVLVGRPCLPPDASVVFQHVAPQRGTGVIEGHVFGQPPERPPFPLPGALVTLLSTNAQPEPPRAISGLDGSYFFVNVPPGVYVGRAEAHGFEPAEARIEVPGGGHVGHDFFLKPGTPTGRVTGMVLQPTAGALAPLPGALVQLLRQGEVVMRTETNDHGMYELPAVQAGAYVLRASHDGFVPQQVEITVGPGQVVVQNFVLQPEHHESGAFAGRVLGRQPNTTEPVPLPDANVVVMSPVGVVARAVTDRQGAFGIPDIPPGHYVAVAQKMGWRPARVEIDIVAGQVTEHVFILEPMMMIEPAP